MIRTLKFELLISMENFPFLMLLPIIAIDKRKRCRKMPSLHRKIDKIGEVKMLLHNTAHTCVTLNLINLQEKSKNGNGFGSTNEPLNDFPRPICWPRFCEKRSMDDAR